MFALHIDTAFSEDNSRIRADDCAEALARIRQMCLNLLKGETTFKGGIKRKRMNCAMDENYLSKVIESLTERRCSCGFCELGIGKIMRGSLSTLVETCNKHGLSSLSVLTQIVQAVSARQPYPNVLGL